MQDGLAPALFDSGDVGQFIANTCCKHNARSRHLPAVGKADTELTLLPACLNGLPVDLSDGWIGSKLARRFIDDYRRRLSILAEKAVRGPRKAIARLAAVDNQNLATRAPAAWPRIGRQNCRL